MTAYRVWCQGGPADDWIFETLVEPPDVIWLVPAPGPTRFVRVLEPWPDSLTYERQSAVEQIDGERIYYPSVSVAHDRP